MSFETIASIITRAGKVSNDAMALACKIYESGAVTLVDDWPELCEDGLVYHLRKQAIAWEKSLLVKSRCALLDESMPLSNGVILGEQHQDMRCSQRPCGYETCPVALAACFRACHEIDEGREIPLYHAYSKENRKTQSEVAAFRKKWTSHLVDSDTALNLLLSERENDFNGALVLKDDSYREDFVDDLGRVLAKMGKIDKGSVVRDHMIQYLSFIDTDTMSFMPGGANLPTRTLFVFDRLQEFADAALPTQLETVYNEPSRGFLVEQLGKIVDNRYVLVVGTNEEIAAFCSMNSKFLHTFDQTRLNLKAMDMDEVYELYLSYLDKDVGSLIEDREKFSRDFKDFVGFNRDSLPFHGREMADYLAKYANALKRPVLPRSSYPSNSLDETLDSIVGLQQVKDTIRQLERYAMFKKRAQADGRELPAVSMHMLFTGNPGTGKTMMAGVIASMLYKIGIIKQNKFHEVTAKDLIAQYVGQTDKKTHAEVLKALDGILFIDEAYALSEGASGEHGYGVEAITELVKSMDEYKDRLIVIFAGYENEMNNFLEMNPGLTSRIGYKFRFEDYSCDQLLEIFDRAATRAGFECEQGLLEVELRELFDYHRRFKSFGNGRFVMEVLHRMVVKHADSFTSQAIDESKRYLLSVADVPSRQELHDVTDWEPTSAEDLLEPLVGMGDLKDKVCELERVVSFYEQGRKAQLKLPEFNLHMIFTGNPGTGKTTIARIIGKILYNVGAIPVDKFIEVEATDLARLQARSGQTSVERYIRDAMGGVLFVDEAYALTYLGEGREIIASLVKAMEDHKGEFVAMFAGYRDEMRNFVAVNPGLASRIGYTFDFADYTTDELQEIFVRKMEKAGFALDAGVLEASHAAFKYFHSVEGFGNGRFVDKFMQEVIARHAMNMGEGELARIAVGDVPSIKDMCKVAAMPVYAPADISADGAKRRIAIHEMGHAVCSLALTGQTNISLVTIEQEGTGALGYVEYKAAGQVLPTSENIQNKLCSLMGGIAAEELCLGAFSSGGYDDLRQATNLAVRYVCSYGMSDAGFVQYLGDEDSSRGLIDATRLPQEARMAMTVLLQQAFDRAKDTIQDNEGVYDAMVDMLASEGTISGESIIETWNELTGGDES